MKPITSFLFFFVLTGCCWSQNATTFANSLADSLSGFSVRLPLESVYISTNKEVFEKGEDLWFAATVLNRHTLQPSPIANTLYVELRSDEMDFPMVQATYTLQAGTGAGHLFLADTLPSGVYWITAFTDYSAGNSTLTKSVRKLLIKERIVPHVFIKTIFEKEAFKKSEAISGEVEVTVPDGGEVAELKTIIEFISKGEVLERMRAKSDDNGRVRFSSKATDFPSGTEVLVRVSHENEEERHAIPIPFDVNEGIKLDFLPEGGKIIVGMSNYIAFKALSADGKPFNIKKAVLYADDEEVSEFQTDHAGMGRFRFFADANKKYQVKVLEPALDRHYDLPNFSTNGAQLHLRDKKAEELTFSLLKSQDFPTDTVHLAVKQRGEVVWVASALLDKSGLLLKVPIVDLPQGIVEISLYNQKAEILAERLVYLHLHRHLNITAEFGKELYGPKEKVKLKLKVTDDAGTPVQSRFSLSVVDEIYAGPFAEKNIASHFLLSNELKGSLFEPSYYFNKDNPRVDDHLDLLMLTQGWRFYEWNFGHLIDLQEVENFQSIGNILGQVELKSLSGSAKREKKLEVQLFGEFGVMLLHADSLGSFLIPEEVLMASKGSVIGVKVVEDKDAVITFSDLFDLSKTGRTVNSLVYDHKRTLRSTKNWDEKTGASDDVIELDEVQITANKVTYDKFWGQPLGIHVPNSSDYVCQYNILNCSNHRRGSPPVAGRVYLSRTGNLLTYQAKKTEGKGITFVKGHYQIPAFYQPKYEENPDERLIPDFRNTLLWEPNLVTDENGEVEISFFTSDIRSLFNCKIEGLGANSQFGVHSFDLKVLR